MNAAQPDRQHLIAACASAMLHGDCVEAVLAAAVDAVGAGMGADLVDVLELRSAGTELALQAGAGWAPGLVGALRVPAAGAPPARALSSPTPVLIDDDLARGPLSPSHRVLLDHGVRSGLYAVVPGRQAPFGVVGAHARSARSFERDDVAFLVTVATTMASALERRRAQRQLDLLVTGVRDHAVYLLDRDGLVTTWNEGAERLTGYRAEEILGSHVRRLSLVEDADAKVDEELRRAIEEGKLEVEGWRVRKDGVRFRAEVQLIALRSVSGELEGVSTIVRDVTDPRLQVHHQLAQSQKLEAVGELAGGVAHDFNNLLNVILGYVEILLEEVAADSPLRADLEGINRAGERAAALVHQLLAFSRRQVLQPAVFDLNETLRSLESMLGRLIGEDMGLVVRPNAGSAHIRADPSQIEQVVVNLVINARDAMPQGGTLKIETSTVDGGGDRRAGAAPGGHVALTVSDTGIGMSAETLSHCFEPFFTTKDPRRGTGLGLATAYGIVRQSGGDLWATSEPGVGTTFTMQLPLVDALPEGSTPDSRHHSPAGEETVLLVEDEDEVRWLARRALDRSGYRVLEATDGVEALDLARASSHPIDVLVTDVVMPRLGGVELSEALEQEGLVRRVLFISGYLDRAPGLEGAAIDTDKLLAKPFRAEDLLSRVRVVLDR